VCPHNDDVDKTRAGTASYHVGSPPDSRSLRTCAKYGIQTNHRARQLTEDDLRNFDYLLAMDSSNLEDIGEMADSITTERNASLGKGTIQF
jgi:protein-tyrosine-phosphatase